MMVIEQLKQNRILWEHFTRKEEYDSVWLDQYRRFPYYLSKQRNIFEPEVSAFLIQNGRRFSYPNGRQFAVCLTHDIDVIHPSKLSLVCDVALTLKKLQVYKALEKSLSWIKKYNPLWNFKKTLDLESKYEAKSTFYFLVLDRRESDFNYNIDELSSEMKCIIKEGWEVGLHGGHEVHDNLQEIIRRKKILEDIVGTEVIGYRSHYVRFKVPYTWKLLEDAGFKYDATFGFADCVGFRNGMCHPYNPFDLNANRFIDILEIPLNIMDCTLDCYMKLDMINSWEVIAQLIDTVIKQNGVLTILWHNTYMVGEKLGLYKKILQYCYERNAWMTSGAEICRWWYKNNYVDYFK